MSDASEFAMSDTSAAEDVAEMKRQLRKALRENAKFKRGTQALVDAVYSVFDEGIELKVPNVPEPGAPAKEGKQEIAALQLTDLQVGKVSPSYDTTIFEERMRKLTSKVQRITEIRQGGAQIDELRLYLTGDLIEGETIFPGQTHEIDSAVLDQALRTTPKAIAEMVLALLGTFAKIRICCVPGNHGRVGKKSDGVNPRSNWDTAVHETLRLMLHGIDAKPHADLRERVEIEIAEDDWHVVDYVWDWGVLLIHGDKGIRGFAGFPWYGAARRISGWGETLEMNDSEPFDYCLFGHFHTPAEAVVNSKQFMCGGSMESDNGYAKSELASAGHPSQRLLFFDEEHGVIDNCLIWLSDEGRRLPARRRHERWTK